MTNPIPISLLFILPLFISPTQSLPTTNVLYSDIGDGILNTGQNLIYRNFGLVMQEDCNLVIYNKGVPIWASGTWHKGSKCYLQLQSNGELVMYGYVWGGQRVIWRTGVTSTTGIYALVLKYDGTLSVQGPAMWTTTLTGPISTSTSAPSIDSTLWSGDIATIGPTIANGDYKLELPDSCNLTLSNTKTGEVLWFTNTTDWVRDCFVNIENNGEFKIKYLGGATLWTNQVGAGYTNNYVLALQPNGKLVVYNAPIWTAKSNKGSGVHVAPAVYNASSDAAAAAEVAEHDGEKIAMVTDHQA